MVMAAHSPVRLATCMAVVVELVEVILPQLLWVPYMVAVAVVGLAQLLSQAELVNTLATVELVTRPLVVQELPLLAVEVQGPQRVALVRAAKFAFGQSGDQHEKS
jgi:hypothetical protein